MVVVVLLLSPNGKLLVFLSCQAAVNSGVHTATNSLHSISWPAGGVISMPMRIKDVVQFSTSHDFGFDDHGIFISEPVIGMELDC